MPPMLPDYRSNLLTFLVRLEQFTTEADAILAAPADVNFGARAEALRELVVEMRAPVEEKLLLLFRWSLCHTASGAIPCCLTRPAEVSSTSRTGFSVGHTKNPPS